MPVLFRCQPALLLLVLMVQFTNGQAYAQQTETFHRLRFEFKTTSDFSTVYFDSRPSLVASRISQTDGLQAVNVGIDSASLVQPIEKAGTEVGVVFDVAFDPAVFRHPFDIRIQRGHLGGSRLLVHNVTPAGLERLGEWRHDEVLPDNPENIRFLSLDFSSVARRGPYEVPPPVPAKMLWAFYFASYTAAGWAGNPALKDAPVSPYASDDTGAIARHLDQARNAGIGGFIVSWDGAGSAPDRNLPAILQAAAARNFAIAGQLETYDAQGQPRTQDQIQQSLAQLLRTHATHAAWHRVGGRPVVFVNDADRFPLATWTAVLAAIRGQGLDGFFLGHGLADDGLDVFEAVYSSVAGNAAEFNTQLIRTRPGLRYYHLLTASPRIHLATATVQPGYDDALLGRIAPGFIDRLSGETYRTAFQRAIESEALWILITSWNQFYENTHIEPSQAYGDWYLLTTASMRTAWDQPMPVIYAGGVVNAASYLHNAVAPGEIVTLFGEGIGPPQICTMQLASGTHAVTELCETEVLFSGTPAPIVFAHSNQTSAVAPLSIQGGRIRVNVRYRGVTGNTAQASVTRAVPGIFAVGSTGAGRAAALHTDYSVVGPDKPASRGSTILVYMTSGGATEPPGEDGRIVSGIEVLQLSVRAEIGGVPATVSFAGSAPSLVKGALQLNIRVPDNAPVGDAVPLVVWIGGMRSQDGINIALR